MELQSRLTFAAHHGKAKEAEFWLPRGQGERYLQATAAQDACSCMVLSLTPLFSGSSLEQLATCGRCPVRHDCPPTVPEPYWTPSGPPCPATWVANQMMRVAQERTYHGAA